MMGLSETAGWRDVDERRRDSYEIAPTSCACTGRARATASRSRSGPDLLVVLSDGGRFDRDRLIGHRVEPFERRVGDFAPAAVDRERVPAAFELPELCDRCRVPVLLPRRARRPV